LAIGDRHRVDEEGSDRDAMLWRFLRIMPIRPVPIANSMSRE
jgi:hypothetical protein